MSWSQTELAWIVFNIIFHLSVLQLFYDRREFAVKAVVFMFCFYYFSSDPYNASVVHTSAVTRLLIIILLSLSFLYLLHCRTTTGRQTVSSRMSPCVSSSVHPARRCALHASVSPSTPSFGGPRNVSKGQRVSRYALRVRKFAHLVNVCLSIRTNGGLQNVRPDPFAL